MNLVGVLILIISFIVIFFLLWKKPIVPEEVEGLTDVIHKYLHFASDRLDKGEDIPELNSKLCISMGWRQKLTHTEKWWLNTQSMKFLESHGFITLA